MAEAAATRLWPTAVRLHATRGAVNDGEWRWRMEVEDGGRWMEVESDKREVRV